MILCNFVDVRHRITVKNNKHRVLFCADRVHKLIVFLQSGNFMLIVHGDKKLY